MIRDWTERNYDFAGCVTGFDPHELGDRDALATTSATPTTRRPRRRCDLSVVQGRLTTAMELTAGRRPSL